MKRKTDPKSIPNCYQNEIKIEKAFISDLEEIVAIQKIAFQNEAELFNDFSITPYPERI